MIILEMKVVSLLCQLVYGGSDRTHSTSFKLCLVSRIELYSLCSIITLSTLTGNKSVPVIRTQSWI